MNRRQQGFTLMELMIVIAIIGILTVIVVPSYKFYTRRAHYAEIVQAAGPFKLAVEECFAVTGSLEDCNSGQQNIQIFKKITDRGFVNDIQVAKGLITITPQEKYGIHPEDLYQLIPDIQHDLLFWKSGGEGVKKGYAS